MTMSSQIIEVLNDLCFKFGLAIDWSQENIMPHLEELAGKYISWEYATSSMWLVLGALLLVVGVTLCVWDWKTHALDGFGCMLGFMFAFVGACMCCTQIIDMLTCKYFPEKMIMEYVRALMRTYK